jgi:ubiquinone/menaquinone biosynthesis C-methylase UbiE
MRWPPPPPGRPEWAWLLGLPPRGWRVRRLLEPATERLGTPARVVSVGGGPGFEFVELEKLRNGRAWRTILLDAQRGMIRHAEARRARSRAPTPELLLGDATALPFPDASTDLVLSLGLLCCLTDAGADAAAAEAWRVVRPGGFVALSVPPWRGSVDEERHTRRGFRRIGGGRPGRAVLQKPL